MGVPYKPIDCLYYDRLEAWATLKESCAIVWLDGENRSHQVQSKIIDLQIHDHAEYLVGEKGIKIRLDQILSINDVPAPGGVCSISASPNV